jgi:ADP-ribose pyrophosphatase YjhB (NUDIX family)
MRLQGQATIMTVASSDKRTWWRGRGNRIRARLCAHLLQARLLTMSRVFPYLLLLVRPMTLGVRAAAFDAEGRICLVRHTYVPGWHLPGGGVDRGETAVQALIKELDEEAHVRLVSKPRLIGVYHNRNNTQRDHVMFYRCDLVEQMQERVADREIAEAAFFPLDDLPDATTPATRRRIQELFGVEEISPYW